MDNPAGGKPRRIWRVVLTISLAFNLAIVGVVAGFVLRDDRSGPPRGYDLSIGPLAMALEAKDRRAIAGQVRDRSSARTSGRAAELDAIAAAVTAAPFNADALSAALAASQSRRDAVLAAATRALVDRVAQMTQDERDAFAARLADQRRGGDRRKD